MSRHATVRPGAQKPMQRRLRVFAFDPLVGAQLETLSISELTLKLLWEDLAPGPVGEYLEVVDYDPASAAFYAPVDLDDKYVLAQNGLAPAEGGPQFHQQMVYAVAMNTIDHFERALGRVACWASRVIRDASGRVEREEYVRRLRIYPHALREANAYYSPAKKALLFGYFQSRGRGPAQSAGGTVFTCLSYDIVAHETTHALLDGLHPSFNEPTNPDVHALHEGFADIVALFQRFAHPEILEHQIARTRGDLEQQNMLGELAQQLGQALGMRKALRSALGDYETDAAGNRRWVLHEPDPEKLAAATDSHGRGAVLLAAVFRAFLSIYKMRSADLFRIATNGTGVLGAGAIHPDLVHRLAREAAAAADAVLTMCIRGLDYCPPVDITLGTYLRAVITADAEVWPQETYPYRAAFAESFRAWGIDPDGARGSAESELRFSRPDDPVGLSGRKAVYRQERTAELFEKANVRRASRPRRGQFDELDLRWDLAADRKQVWKQMDHNAEVMWRWLAGPAVDQLPAFGLNFEPDPKPSVYRSKRRFPDRPSIEVHSVRVARRRGFRDTQVTDLVVEVRQRRRGYYDKETQERVDAGGFKAKLPPTDFKFRRGCTLIIDPLKQEVRYAIATRGDVTDDAELERVRRFLTGRAAATGNPFYRSDARFDEDDEHFAALHRHEAAAADF